jgi:hypothetical protein
MFDLNTIALTRVIYEERVNEYKLRRVDTTENALILAFSALKNALFGKHDGRNESSAPAAKAGKLAAR